MSLNEISKLHQSRGDSSSLPAPIVAKDSVPEQTLAPAGSTITTRISIPFSGILPPPKQAPAPKGRSSKSRSKQKQEPVKQQQSSESDERPGKSIGTARSKSKKTTTSGTSSRRKATIANESEESEEDDDFYFQGATARKASSAQRRAQPDAREIFNGHLDDIIDACVREDRNRIFTQKVTEKEAPNYFAVVKQPIDLSMMKGKTKRREYADLIQFKDDMALMRQNSVLYNGPVHAVTGYAKNLEKVALRKIHEKGLDNFEFAV